MGTVISFINMKGGVGKTTLCIGVGEYFANTLNKKVLIIDLDPQFNATQSLLDKYNQVDNYLSNYRHTKTVRQIFATTTDVYKTNTVVKSDEIIHEFSENLDVILGDINIIFDNNTMDNTRFKRVKKFISENKLKEVYDYIFIDCPPTISLYTDSAIIASDYYLVPIRIDQYSILGITNLLTVINNLKYDEELGIKPLGIIYTNIENNLTQKTQSIKDNFELEPGIRDLYFFKSVLSEVRDLKVGNQGNIASHYKKSREDIHRICLEIESLLKEGN